MNSAINFSVISALNPNGAKKSDYFVLKTQNYWQARAVELCIEKMVDLGPWEISFVVIQFAVGITLCFFGYALFSILVFGVGFFFAFVITFVLIANNTGLAMYWVVLIAAVAGLIVGIITKKLIQVAIFLIGAVGGYFLAVFIQETDPENGLIEISWVLWLFIVLTMILCGALACAFVRPAIIVITAVWGGYFILSAINLLIGGNALFTLNFQELITDDKINLTATPLETWVFYVYWAVAALLGGIFQFLGPFKNFSHKKAPYAWSGV